MTRAEALSAAREKFGPRATVDIDLPHFYPRLRYVHPTGEHCSGRTGRGKNWDDALAQAEYHENKRLGVWS